MADLRLSLNLSADDKLPGTHGAIGGYGVAWRRPSLQHRRSEMAQQKTLDDLFLDTLKDIYFAEKQIVKALPKMAKAATSPDLKAGFDKHLQETESHLERLL